MKMRGLLSRVRASPCEGAHWIEIFAACGSWWRGVSRRTLRDTGHSEPLRAALCYVPSDTVGTDVFIVARKIICSDAPK